MSFTHQIIEIGWQQEQENISAIKPSIILRELKTGKEKPIPLEPGNPYEFNWKLSPRRFCPGYVQSGESFPCKFANTIQGMYERCAYCDKKSDFSMTFLMGGDQDERGRKYLTGSQIVYLAYFQPDIVKVGTATEERKYVRLIEQDALIALHIAEGTGAEMLKLERKISTQLGYPEAVSSRQKFNFLSNKPNLERAKPLLIAAWQKIYDYFNAKGSGVNSEYKIHKPANNTNSVIDLSANPNIFYLPQERHVHKMKIATEFLAGKYLGLRGKYLVLEKDDEILAFNKQYLVGRKLVATEENLLYKIEKPEQLKLL